MIGRALLLSSVVVLGAVTAFSGQSHKANLDDRVVETSEVAMAMVPVRTAEVNGTGLAAWYRKKDDCPKLCAAFPCCPPEALNAMDSPSFALASPNGTLACGGLAE